MRSMAVQVITEEMQCAVQPPPGLEVAVGYKDLKRQVAGIIELIQHQNVKTLKRPADSIAGAIREGSFKRHQLSIGSVRLPLLEPGVGFSKLVAVKDAFIESFLNGNGGFVSFLPQKSCSNK